MVKIYEDSSHPIDFVAKQDIKVLIILRLSATVGLPRHIYLTCDPPSR